MSDRTTPLFCPLGLVEHGMRDVRKTQWCSQSRQESEGQQRHPDLDAHANGVGRFVAEDAVVNIG